MLDSWTKVWYVLGLRALAWDKCCPIRWDTKSRSIKIQRGYGVTIWWLWFLYFVIYCFCDSRYLYQILRSDQVSLKSFVITSGYFIMNGVVVVMFLLMGVKTDEFVNAGNILVRTDDLLQAIFQRPLNQRASTLTTNRRFRLHKITVMLTTLCAIVLPPLFLGRMILNPLTPLNRFIHSITGYKPKFELASLPFVLFSSMVGTKGGPLGTVLLNTGLMYMQFESFWFQALCPERQYAFGNIWKTPLGPIREDRLYFIYRWHQIVNIVVNQFYVYTTFHVAGALGVASFCVFALIKLANKQPFGVVLVITSMFVMAILVLGFEVYFVSGTFLASNRFICSLRRDGDTRRGSWRMKRIRTLRPLHFNTGGAFFKIDNATLLYFVKVGTDITISLIFDLNAV
ncbi:uncharacterized protein LOC118434071 isoform X2 [Folsomia candida]|uniref:uncharacterized protein LOC118434071 isoform X2 n=1 Tax=Folsomia candida TaxID=158441 RepID=UPI001605165D|nr:uncharacterized protein LOC118434071 isoform X2 [Folsomia candida]